MISTFMEVAFDKNLKALIIDGFEHTEQELVEAWENIQMEYTDCANLAKPEINSLTQQFYLLDARLKTIPMLIDIERQSIKHFNNPFLPAFPYFQKFSYRLHWSKESGDLKEFEKQLQRIEAKEKRYKVEFDIVNEKLTKMLDENAPALNGQKNLTESRRSFIRMLNSMRSYCGDIPKTATTMEELGLMIKDYNDYLINKRNENARKR
ncbi:hypothetical protein [Rhizosphaericola mali]|uniref:Uncharacterized protein n=1 Tax=Rhizosphaericola mali TaxID=2545455 RepID=A0A5P2G533_9BACT|nr:hypothetical protein [Rhizosphaericola mali]QES88870.1 hypothetical protein E0W69_009450 [Rhizosphaericola mali]